MFADIFGNTTYAASAVTAAFMGGLALGSYYFGCLIDKKKNIFIIYAFLELGIMATALSMPSVLALINSFYALIFPLTNYSTIILLVVKTVISFIVLIIPTSLMGGTLPILVRFFVRRVNESGIGVGILYSVNTLGATVGCFITGFILIEKFGVIQSTQLAAGINLLLALVFILLHYSSVQNTTSSEEITSPIDVEEEGLNNWRRRIILSAYGLAGFISLSLEILWMRLLVFQLNTTIYAFTIMLTTFLIGIGIGSLLITFSEKIRWSHRYYQIFGIIETLIGLFALLSIILLGRFDIINQLWLVSSWEEKMARDLLYATVIMLPGTILMGMAMPVVSRIVIQNTKSIGQSFGKIYALNTLGGIVGSLLTGFWLVLSLGTQSTIILVSTLALIIGTAVIIGRPARETDTIFSKRGIPAIIGLIWIGCLIIIFQLPSDHLYQYYNTGEQRVNSQVEIQYANEGIECITTVHKYPNGDRVISTGSMNVAGTEYTLRTTQKLQAHIPMLLHGKATHVLQIGFGSGETSSILTNYPTKQVDVVEISKGVINTADRFFRDVNNGVINHPKFRAIIMDGANYVALSDHRYDLILNDSIWPYYSGNSGLYTQEHFAAGKKLLKPGGMMTSWVPLDMPLQSFKTLLRTFSSVYEYVSIWMAVTHKNKHAILVGSSQPPRINMDRFIDDYFQFAAEDLNDIKLTNPVLLLDTYRMSQSEFSPWVGSGNLHTVNHPVLEFAQRLAQDKNDLIRIYEFFNSSGKTVHNIFKQKNQLETSPNYYSDIEEVHQASQLVMSAIIERTKGNLGYLDKVKLAMEIVPDHPGANNLMADHTRLVNADMSKLNQFNLTDLLKQGEEFLSAGIFNNSILVYKRAVQINDQSIPAWMNLGESYFQLGQFLQAFDAYNHVLELNPTSSKALIRRGMLNQSRGDHASAHQDLSLAIENDSDNSFAYNNRAISNINLGNYVDGLNDFIAATEVNPEYTEAFYNIGVLYQNNFQHLGCSQEDVYDIAMEYYTAAITVDTTYANAYIKRGLLYSSKDYYSLAIQDFSTAMRYSPEQGEIYYHLGLIHRELGNNQMAKQYFNKANQLRKN